MTTTLTIDYTDLPRNADDGDVRDALAKALDAAGYLVTDTHGQSSKPATYWGMGRWHSTPFQCCDTDGAGVAEWLVNDGCYPARHRDISEVDGDVITIELPDDIDDMDDDDLQRAVALARWAKKNDIDTDSMDGFVTALRHRAAKLEALAEELA